MARPGSGSGSARPSRHDVRDYDLQIPAIVTTVPIHGVDTEIVLVAGKMGKVYAYRAADGRPLWRRSVGRHLNDTGPLPRRTVTIFPGDLGGVETPMALDAGRLFVPWVDLPISASATGPADGLTGHELPQGSRRLHGLRRRQRAADLAAQAAVDGLRRGDRRERRRLHERPTRAGSTPSTSRPARRSGPSRRPPGSTRSRPSTATRCSSARATPGSPRNRSSSSSPTRSRAPAPSSCACRHHRRAHARRLADGRPHGRDDQVTGKEFRFRLSTKSITKPGTVTFSIQERREPSCTTSVSTASRRGSSNRARPRSSPSGSRRRALPLPLHRARPCRRGDARRLHGTLTGCIEPARVARVPSASATCEPAAARFWAGRRARSKPWDHALAKRPCP